MITESKLVSGKLTIKTIDNNEIMLKVAMHESLLGKNVGSNGCNSAGSCGIMQINKYAHPCWFNAGGSECSGQDKTVWDAAGCNSGETAMNDDCNIKLGIAFLKDLYNKFGTSGNSNPACTDAKYRQKYINYRDWDAALRAYNGWGCTPPGADINYVENVKSCNYLE